MVFPVEADKRLQDGLVYGKRNP